MHTRALAVFGAFAVAGALTVTGVTTASAAPPEPPVRGDVDGDGLGDLAVGVPNFKNERGVVDLHYTSRPSQRLRHSDVAGDGAARPGDRFGASVLTVDTNDDGYSDVLVGAPGHEGGHVYLFYGSADGISLEEYVDLQPGSVEPGDRFGAAMAINGHPKGGLNVWVGAPRDDIRGVQNAGSIRHYRLVAEDGGTDFRHIERVHQDSAGVPGANEQGDKFGAVIDASPSFALVGVPSEDVSGARNAGSAVSFRLGESNETEIVQRLSQLGDAPGAPERGDRFGAAVSIRFGTALIGVPGEDLKQREDAGAAAFYEMRGNGRLQPDRTLTQNSKRIPGKAEAGDKFGSSVLLGTGFVCANSADAAIGAPFEDVRGHKNAGNVTLMYLNGEDECRPPFNVTQGDELTGKLEAGDRLGAELAIEYELADHSEGEPVYFEQIFLGSPGENRDGAKDAGQVQISPRTDAPGTVPTIIVDGESRRSVTYSGGVRDDLQYGAVIA